MKKMFTLFLALILCLTLSAGLCEETADGTVAAPGSVTAEMIRNAIGNFRQTALDSDLIASNPSEDSDNEGSWILEYSFGNIHANTATLTEDSVIYDITVVTDEWEVLPGAAVNCFATDIPELFRNDNAGLAGDYYGALIYLDGDPETGFSGGLLSREGQKTAFIQYETVTPNGTMFDNAGIIFFVDGGVVTGIELYADDAAVSPEDAFALYALFSSYADMDDYTAVITDYNDGTGLDPFSAEDLIFSGIDFLNADSSLLPNRLEEMYIDNGNGTFLHRIDGEGYNIIFAADEDGKDVCVDTMTITGDNLEGPRCVRIGDGLIDDLSRFRYEDTEFDYDNMFQMLYGTRNVVPYGIAEYHADGTAELIYTAEAEDGMTVMLRLEYSSDGMLLTAITVKIM